MSFQRECGILLHPTSLPGPYGIGELGAEAMRFVDELKEAGQHLWQILPLGPTGYGDSPYQSLSTFAGNPLLISFDSLVEEGLLSRRRLNAFPRFPEGAVDYGEVIPLRMELLESVARSFRRKASDELKQLYDSFCRRNGDWLEDYALFVAIKRAHDLRPWPEWDPGLARRDADALRKARRKHRVAIHNEKVLQFLFDRQWHRVRGYANQNGVRLVGDIPIFVAHDSADVWADRELYFMGEDGQPTVIAGVPPDYFSATGQRWGNPLYRWAEHERTGYAWWIRRMRKVFDLVDIVRIDHFRGFEGYWEIPGDEPTAVNGKWVKGPGASVFEALHEALGELPIIAEDLGVITDEVEALRDQYDFPGMRVLQFAFGDDPKAEDYRPDSFPANSCCYTGTHDNDTTVGWFWSDEGSDTTRTQEQIERERQKILDYVGTDGSEIHWDLIRVAVSSASNTVVIPMQDVLGLGTEARMNVPGRPGGNWQWRLNRELWTGSIRARLRAVCEKSHRVREQ